MMTQPQGKKASPQPRALLIREYAEQPIDQRSAKLRGQLRSNLDSLPGKA